MDEGQAKVGLGRKAAKGCGIAFIGLIGLIVVAFLIDPEGYEAAMEAQREEERKQAAEAAELAKVEASQWMLKILTFSGGCDSRMAELGAAMEAVGGGSGDVFEGYAKASEARQSCEQVWLGYPDIAVPDALEEWEDEAEAARDQCKLAAFSKREAAGKSMELFDGNARPSVVNGMRDDLSLARSEMVGCAAKIANIAEKAGVDLKEVLPKSE